ncbi:MAG: nutrient deprivation-induced protein [Hyphomicrobiales bacterium]|nr:nutrient deprivation-induced protein [Hyphomicrobiales bacterium]
MADYSNAKSSTELEAEVEAQRNRVENTVGEIQQRLSPGQLVDELLSYTKSGGGEFAANLGRSMQNNPLPVALLGVSLFWLMARPGGNGKDAASRTSDRRIWEDERPWEQEYGLEGSDDYPTTEIGSSGMRRVSQNIDESGQHYSEFSDDTGRKFRAFSDEAGHRAGHFMDEAGNNFRGFTDAAGNRVEAFRDEAGNLLDEAMGWASHTFRATGHRLRGMQHGLGQSASEARHRASQLGGTIQHQADATTRTIVDLFQNQPLIGGAVAFAVGAAIASALPHTDQEDNVLGPVADRLKRQAGDAASDVYDKNKEKVADLYQKGAEKVGVIYEQAKSDLGSPASDSSGTH